jgi:hypothetical protein
MLLMIVMGYLVINISKPMNFHARLNTRRSKGRLDSNPQLLSASVTLLLQRHDNQYNDIKHQDTPDNSRDYSVSIANCNCADCHYAECQSMNFLLTQVFSSKECWNKSHPTRRKIPTGAVISFNNWLDSIY